MFLFYFQHYYTHKGSEISGDDKAETASRRFRAPRRSNEGGMSSM
jgi:hypothetical protein